MVLSGFYDHDIPVVCAAAEPLGLRFEKATAMRADQEGEPAAIGVDELSAHASVASPDLGRYGAVEAASPDAAWACLTLRKL